MTPHDFVAKWRASTLTERASAQEHFLDLCRLLGQPTPAEDDPTGTRYTFERGATKTSGGQGWADVWKRGAFAWEYKGKHKDLDKAYQQLLLYRESLENPPLLVVSDIETIALHTNFTNSVKRVVTWTLDDLLDATRRDELARVWTTPDAFRSHQTTEEVTQQAAREFARLAEVLRQWQIEPRRAAHFLIRLLFCLFAEDVGLLPRGLFSELIEATLRRPDSFAERLRQLFAAMRHGGFFGVHDIAYFNGGLFDDDDVVPLPREAIEIVRYVSRLDWSAMEPAILGTLFERSLDPAKRSQLGAHYTSREDILLIVEPVLMAPLRRRWATVRGDAEALADKGKRKEAAARLLAFAEEVRAVRVLDPAAGSGNFLYLALKSLLDLEKEVSLAAQELTGQGFLLGVGPEQLHGIEKNETAHELAQATIWIGYIQWLRDNGFGQPSEPILKPIQTVQCMDAILAYDDAGRPVEPAWPAADVIIGNPPFLGDKKMRGELGDKYVNDLRKLYEGRISGGADLVTYWFERVRAEIEARVTNRAGLISTNSIRSGANRLVLERIKETGDIFMAWSDRPWILEGAAVRVSLVGFDHNTDVVKFLDGKKVEYINSDLTSGTNVISAVPLDENQNIVFLGMMKAGPFDINGELARTMLRAPTNPNSRPNSDVVKQRIAGQDVTQGKRDIWIIDFGTNTSEEEAALYELPFEYVRQHVKPVREQVRRKRQRDLWWLFGETRPGLRNAIKNLERCIVTPEVSKYRLFVWMDTSIIPDHKLHVFARDDDYFFGVLQSHIHEIWSLAQGSWLGVGNDPSYSSSRTFLTFPFPWPPDAEPSDDPRVAAIADAARELVAKRDAWLHAEGADARRTLTALYNQRPTWLDHAHRRLDHAVLDAYGWPHDLSDEAILERLLALNGERHDEGMRG